MTMDSDKLEIAFKIQKRILGEVRRDLTRVKKELIKTLLKLATSEVAERELSKQLRDVPLEINEREMEITRLQGRIKNLNDKFIEINKKDMEIVRLQSRIRNLNDELNGTHNGNRATTSEDVYKIMEEKKRNGF